MPHDEHLCSLVKFPVCEIDFVLDYLLNQFSFGSEISSVPFSPKAVFACSSFNSASYEKRGPMNRSGHEDFEEVDSEDCRIMVLSPEEHGESSGRLAGKK